MQWTAGEGRCVADWTCNVSYHVAIVHVAATYSCVVLAYTCHSGVLVGRAGLNTLKVSVPHATLGRTFPSSKCLPSSKVAKPLSLHVKVDLALWLDFLDMIIHSTREKNATRGLTHANRYIRIKSSGYRCFLNAPYMVHAYFAYV